MSGRDSPHTVQSALHEIIQYLCINCLWVPGLFSYEMDFTLPTEWEYHFYHNYRQNSIYILLYGEYLLIVQMCSQTKFLVKRKKLFACLENEKISDKYEKGQ